MKNRFIKTSDEHTAKMLRESGLTELAKEDGKWVFVNDNSKITMEEAKDVHLTDILCF